MGEWSDVAYLRSADLAQVWPAVDALCAAEGYRPVPPPAPRQREVSDPMQYGPGSDSPLWAVGLVPGGGEWTALLSAPLRLLGERSDRTGRARLVDLAGHAGREAFLFSLSDGTAWLLAEATPAGELAVSGVPYDDDDFDEDDDSEWEWVEDLLGPDYPEMGFQLLTVSTDLRKAAGAGAAAVDAIPAAVGARDYYSAFWYNSLQMNNLLPHNAVDLPGVEVRYYRG